MNDDGDDDGVSPLEVVQGERAWARDTDHPVLYAELHQSGPPVCLTCDEPACETCMRLHALWDSSSRWCQPCARERGAML